QVTWCKTKAPTRWPGSILTSSGRTCPARAPRGRHVPRRPIYSSGSPISALRSTSGWPACTTAAQCSIPSSSGSVLVMPALPDGMLTAALRFENATRRGGTWPVAYPADKQADVPLEYGAESPNPIPNHGTGGYPITLQFPPFDKVTGVSAKL